MFQSIFLVILLAALSGAAIGGVLVGRRFLGVVERRAKIESVKLDTELDRLKHVRSIADYSQKNELLQLTVGDGEASRLKEKHAQEEIKKEAATAEQVDYKRGDVHEPAWFPTVQEAKEARDAEEGIVINPA